MSFEELVKRISPTLKKITYKLNGHFSYFNDNDLYQEALLYLWQEFSSAKLQDKTDSYILQGCFYYLKNFLRKKREKVKLVSIDSFVKNEEDIDLEEKLPSECYVDSIESLENNLLLEQIQNNDLTKREKEVISLYLEGLTVREIGKKLNISHVRVIRIRNNIKRKLSYLKR
ncbi:MAG: sigma-70 family RNA polymerase sigma factor [Candidatus Omnitrophica bacterium]|nr:sigma-70 family RNA polymerase sigma factor [Candidatus Omnitrophota bacterium]